jgi:hypothetical protein
VSYTAPPDCDDDNFFECATGRCIPVTFRCDDKFDCGPGDFTDEDDCPSNYIMFVVS